MEVITKSHEATVEFACEFAARLKQGDIVALRGGMGAGKTAFTSGLAIGLGITEPVSSPTYSICNIYSGAVTLCHFDMYKIDGALSLESTGFFDYAGTGCITVIEWSENIQEFLPIGTIVVEIEVIDGDMRRVRVR
ncbi:MAG: tRNA (adenosine(37)-N6)-threonylcarbamoyltransferase complex ATPase subunit type 1 TsaE [Oscillospiraceae bacterium]|nr:tRNA (adenosine(37)-N6)-threonylcarbamoyltransferase complex ATPase subunit type 1 TsaE [Oscillospiraceae bacterium]